MSIKTKENEAVEETTVETPAETPTEETTAGDEAAEAAKSILKTLNVRLDAEIDAKIDKIKADIDAKVKDFMAKHGKADTKAAVSFDREKYNEWAKSVKAGQKANFSFDIPVDLLKAKSVPVDHSVDGSFDGDVALSELDPVVSHEPVREPFIEDLVTVGRISKPIDVWIETTNSEGQVLPVAELALIPQKSWDFAERSARVRKIGAHTKHSAEMAEDLPNLIGEIRNFLIRDLRLEVDRQILKGDGEGENLTGILENATAYNAGSFAGTVLDANHFDVIETAVTQVIVAHHMPNYVVVNPVDRAKMRLSKGNDGHYVMPPFITGDGATVSGLRVVANTGVDVGKFLVGDFRKSSVKYARGLTVEMSNSDQDDFVRDRFTTKATVRLVHRVRENDFAAFVYGDFEAAKAAIEIGS